MFYTEYDKSVLPPLLLAIVAVVAILAILLRNKPEWVRAIPTALVAVALLFIEVVKQRWNILGEFDPYHLPFHYCSLFFVVVPLAELFGKRASRIFRPIATCMSFMVVVAMYVYPQGIMNTDLNFLGVDFKATHGVIFHHLILLYFLLVVAMRLCRPVPRDALNMGIVGLAYASVVFPLSCVFGENYCNFLYSVIPPLESLREAFGQDLYTVFTIFAITAGAIFSAFVYLALYYTVRGIFKLCALCFRQIKRLLCHRSKNVYFLTKN